MAQAIELVGYIPDEMQDPLACALKTRAGEEAMALLRRR